MLNCFLSLFVSVEVSYAYVKVLSIIVFFSNNLFFWISFLKIFLNKICFVSVSNRSAAEKKESHIFKNNFLQNTQEFKR
jgi:hypothetical protein